MCAGHAWPWTLQKQGTDPGPDPGPGPEPGPEIDPDYELMAYSNTKIDYEYIINLIQNIVSLLQSFSDVLLA